MSEYRPDTAQFNVGNARVAIITARWNGNITEPLLAAAEQTLAAHGVAASAVESFRVPGAFELPLAAQQAARSGRFDAVIALGCVIRGDTPHFDYVCAETTRGIGEVALHSELPVGFGLLTTDDLRQAELRSADNDENKGREAALTVLEMITALKAIKG
ncbi:6,7-dimethyl-8-ribityllumazine synthase [Gammaproteobacteria bacterium LSUCC0057]|jgi:6,7-dimethyl-8-ribityllumazine synthase|uniref:6,7-dimethyl-8-ribityllumazine synthase n=1 Tax=Gammaproteobacteria bacterium LSUCC0057 TaxID=2559237 RepID=A0A4Y8UJ06_9GAMM|nr:6,7-dimethyl-8-ribityllumazine synthase [Gammaproteobacteria bacterium LSUCC0057]